MDVSIEDGNEKLFDNKFEDFPPSFNDEQDGQDIVDRVGKEWINYLHLFPTFNPSSQWSIMNNWERERELKIILQFSFPFSIRLWTMNFVVKVSCCRCSKFPHFDHFKFETLSILIVMMPMMMMISIAIIEIWFWLFSIFYLYSNIIEIVH